MTPPTGAPGRRVDAVAFDLDGTLIDSRADLTAALDRLRAELGLGALAAEAVERMLGEGAPILVARALADADPPPPAEASLARFLELYTAQASERTRPYPGIPELLDALAPRHRLALLTNKPEGPTGAVLAGLGLADRFELVVGGDTLPTRKPDPAGLLAIAERFEVPRARLLLVGDSPVDAATAKNAGSPFALVEWGYATEEERAAIDAEVRVKSAEALGQWLGLPR